MSAPRIGYCCRWLPPPGDTRPVAALNLRDTTVTSLLKLTPAEATARLLALVEANLNALSAQVEDLASQPPIERCFRLASNILPCATHPGVAPRYAEPALRELAERGLPAIGARIAAADIRVSLHPGPFCILATLGDASLRNALDEVEYHTELMRLLGLAGGWHPRGAHINIHVGSRAAGIAAFAANLDRCSADARGLLTVENDETMFGLDDVLPLAERLPIVLDLHHHWCHSGGAYIAPDDPRVARVRDSWRGVRPVAHLSAPREALVPGMSPDVLPDYAALAAAGVSARDLRAHSERMWNRAVNRWALGHLAWADLEVEAKGKNLASHDLALAAAAQPG